MSHIFTNPFEFSKESHQLSSKIITFFNHSSSFSQITPIQPNKSSNLFLNQMTSSTSATQFFTSSIKSNEIQQITPKLFSKSVSEYLISLQEKEIVSDIFPISSNKKYKSKNLLQQRLSHHSVYSTAIKKITNNYDNVDQYNSDTEDIHYHKKSKVQSAKKAFSSHIKFIMNENKESHNQPKLFQIFRDSDIGIVSKWQKYQKYDEDITSDDEQIECAIQTCLNELRDGIKTHKKLKYN